MRDTRLINYLGYTHWEYALLYGQDLRQRGMTVFRLTNASTASVWRPGSTDHLEQLTGNVSKRYWSVDAGWHSPQCYWSVDTTPRNASQILWTPTAAVNEINYSCASWSYVLCACVNHQYKINKYLEDHATPRLKLHSVKDKGSSSIQYEYDYYLHKTKSTRASTQEGIPFTRCEKIHGSVRLTYSVSQTMAFLLKNIHQ